MSHDSHSHHHVDFDDPAMIRHAIDDGEAMLPITLAAIDRLADAVVRAGLEPRRILDLGSGPGIGSCALAERFERADVVAVDSSSATLQEAALRAASLGVAERVVTTVVDLPAGLDTVGQADLVWASMSLHHLGDERAALRSVTGLLRPGGLVALVERARPTRLLVDGSEIGDVALWDRLDRAWSEWFDGMRSELADSVTSGDLVQMVDDAGLEVIADDELTAVVAAPLHSSTRRYALDQMGRMRHQLSDHVDPADVTALEALVEAANQREDLAIRPVRRFVLARARA